MLRYAHLELAKRLLNLKQKEGRLINDGDRIRNREIEQNNFNEQCNMCAIWEEIEILRINPSVSIGELEAKERTTATDCNDILRLHGGALGIASTSKRREMKMGIQYNTII